MTNKTMINRWSNSVQNNYGSPSIGLVKGKGIVVTDADGKQYLDFLGGIATNILGHAHPAIVKAVTKQVSILSHVSNYIILSCYIITCFNSQSYLKYTAISK